MCSWCVRWTHDRTYDSGSVLKNLFFCRGSVRTLSIEQIYLKVDRSEHKENHIGSNGGRIDKKISQADKKAACPQDRPLKT